MFRGPYSPKKRGAVFSGFLWQYKGGAGLGDLSLIPKSVQILNTRAIDLFLPFPPFYFPTIVFSYHSTIISSPSTIPLLGLT